MSSSQINDTDSAPPADNNGNGGAANPYAGSLLAAARGGAARHSERPTRVRYLILALIVCMSILLYLDRFAFSPAQTTIGAELNMNKEQLGVATSWFFYAYALVMIPAAWMSDNFGARRMLFLYVALWSAAVALMGFAQGTAMIAVGRFLLGVGQAGAYPAAAGLIKKWVPAQNRGTANSMISMAGRGGMLITMTLTPILMTAWGAVSGMATGQWRAVFIFYGALGLVWCAIYWWKFRDTPAQHPDCNDAERELIAGPVVAETAAEKEAEKEVDAPQPATVLAPGYSDRYCFYRGCFSMVMLCAINFFVNIGWIFLATWMPTFLETVHGLSRTSAGLMTSLAGLCGMCGCLSGGLLTDALVRRFGLGWGRRLPGLLGSGLAASVYFICLQVGSVWAYVALFAVAYFVIDLGLGALWSTYQDIGGKSVATLLGIGNTCGNLAAAIFATQIGVLAEANQWQSVFLYSCGSFLIVFVAWLFVRADLPMLKEAK